MVLLTGNLDSYVQFITVLLIFVLVLGITALTTKWIANYQKQQCENGNVQVVETARISNNKYIQVIRVGEKYMAIAVCKDTVTMLGEVPKEQLNLRTESEPFHFKSLLEKAMKKNDAALEEPKEKQSHDEQQV